MGESRFDRFVWTMMNVFLVVALALFTVVAVAFLVELLTEGIRFT